MIDVLRRLAWARIVVIIACSLTSVATTVAQGCTNRGQLDALYCDENNDLAESASDLGAGVLHRALEGYGRLMVRGTFKLQSAVKTATTRLLRHANPLPAFIKACCVKQPEAECRLADFYAAYAEWARRMAYTLTQNQQTVSLNLEHLGFAAKTTSRGTVFVGLAIVNPDQR